MGCSSSSTENSSMMYGNKFLYRNKEIKLYRYIIYEGVQFRKSIVYEDARVILKDILYPFLINDMHTGRFLFVDEYNIPMMCTSEIRKNKHSINIDKDIINNLFKDYLSLNKKESPKVICSEYNDKYSFSQLKSSLDTMSLLRC